jgi:hypothetical protein
MECRAREAKCTKMDASRSLSLLSLFACSKQSAAVSVQRKGRRGHIIFRPTAPIKNTHDRRTASAGPSTAKSSSLTALLLCWNNYLRSAALKPTLVLRDPQQAQRWTRSAVAPQFRLLRSSQCDGIWDGCYFCSDRRSVFLLCPAGVLTTAKAKRRASMVVKLTVDAALHIQRLICV